MTMNAAATSAPMAMFDAARLLLRAHGHSVRGQPGFSDEHWIEAQERLEQLSFIVNRVRELHRETWTSRQQAAERFQQLKGFHPRLREPAGESEVGLLRHLESVAPIDLNGTEINVLTEAFYYVAARLRTVLREHIPGLRRFEVAGVRDVRNKLLEHPEDKSSTVIENGRSYSLTDGPIIKGVRRTDKAHIFPDRGLYVNAEEFRSVLVERLKRLIDQASP